MSQPKAPRSSMTEDLLKNVYKPVDRLKKNETPKRMLKSPYIGSLRGHGGLFTELDKTSTASKNSSEASKRIRSFLDKRTVGGKKRRRTKKKRKRRRTKKKRKSRRRKRRRTRK